VAEETVSTAGAAAGAAAMAQLEPVYLNKALQRMLEVKNAEDYTYTMDKQLARNPMLAMLFANCARQLLAGKVCCVKQYMPMFSSATSVAPSAQAVFIHLQVSRSTVEQET
jgi:hypothetical protein